MGGETEMKKCRITVMKVARYDDLIEKYENPIEHACDMKEGQVFIANGWERPEGFCLSAWESMSAFVLALSHGGGDFYLIKELCNMLEGKASAATSLTASIESHLMCICAEESRLKGGEKILVHE